MIRGTGHTSNKFVKTIGTRSWSIVVGPGELQSSLGDLKAGRYPDAFTKDDIAEIIAAFDPDAEAAPDGMMTAQEVEDLLAEKKLEWAAEQYEPPEPPKEEKVEALGDINSLDEFKKADKEMKNVTPPNGKRGPGRPRKVSKQVSETGEVHKDGSQ